jgi:hypothetical protein
VIDDISAMGNQNQRKRRVSALSLTGACRFTYL